MKIVYLLFFLLGFKAIYAHQPDLSSLMIYEQNGKSILLIKSSLTAFEGEIDYNFRKGAYKTPEEFIQLVKRHFEKNCLIQMNGDTVAFTNLQVQLGHETTLFAELVNVPLKLNSFYIKNTLFKDMPKNQCELILTTKGLPQKQYILNNDNHQEIKLKVENEKWVADKTAGAIFITSGIPTWIVTIFVFILTIFIHQKCIDYA